MCLCVCVRACVCVCVYMLAVCAWVCMCACAHVGHVVCDLNCTYFPHATLLMLNLSTLYAYIIVIMEVTEKGC